MTKDKTTIFIALGAVFLISLGVFAIMRYFEDKINWNESYPAEEKGAMPYSTSIVYGLLENTFKGQGFTKIDGRLSEELKPENYQDNPKSNYIFIGNELYLDSAGTETLIDFVEDGNDAFISCKSIPYVLMEKILGKEYATDSSVYMDNYTNSFSQNTAQAEILSAKPSSAIFSRRHKETLIQYTWQHYSPGFEGDSLFKGTVLGKIEGKANFIKLKTGNGHFYLHLGPLMFTNYNLLEEPQFGYAQAAFSFLGKHPTFWDEASKTEQLFDNSDFRRNRSQKSPLQFILSEEALTWAWYLLLSATGLFLLFYAKRKQRAIPVKEAKTNTSLEFINVIGRMYFLQTDHKSLCRQKMKMFLSFVRSRYGISTNDLDEETQELIAKKSGVAPEDVKKIFSLNKHIESQTSVIEEAMQRHYRAIENFKQNCK